MERRIQLAGLAEAAGALAALATVAGFLGALAWWLDLASHFRVQYFLCLSLVGLVALARKRRGAAAIWGAGALANLAVIVPLYLSPGRNPTPAGPVLRAMLVNVNTHRGDPARVVAEVRRQKPDVLVLEEISDGWIRRLAPLTNDYPHRVARPREDNFGLAVWSRHRFIHTSVECLTAAETPAIHAAVDSPIGPVHVFAVHPLPPAGRAYADYRDEELRALPAFASRARTQSALVIGDLNATPWSHAFRRLRKESGLLDSARGFGVQPTWPAMCIAPLRIPIDHALHTPDLTAVRRFTGRDAGSDHLPLIVDLGRVPKS